MKILILGATGFVGSWLTSRLLLQTNHEITCGVQNIKKAEVLFPQAQLIYCNFLQDDNIEDWLPRLAKIDVVINCVGIFYASKQNTWKIHYHTPKAIYLAAQELKINRIIHLSALGIENYGTEYANSKLGIEAFLQGLDCPHFILKPSLIYGPGASGGTNLLTALASLPFFTLLPGAGEQKLQPIQVQDYVDSIIPLIETPGHQSLIITPAASEALSIRDIMLKLRHWLGYTHTTFLEVPLWFLKIIAKIGDYIPSSLINNSSITMLDKNNLTTPQKVYEFELISGIKPSHFTEGLQKNPSSKKDRWYASLYFSIPLLRLSLVFMWIFSALTSVFFASNASYELLSAADIPKPVQSTLLYSAGILNVLIGLALLFNYKTRLNCLLQIAVISFYTLFISYFLPNFWLEPFGPVVKNIPILVSIILLLLLS